VPYVTARTPRHLVSNSRSGVHRRKVDQGAWLSWTK
jgi:hypothetical protein